MREPLLHTDSASSQQVNLGMGSFWVAIRHQAGG